jgi:hypothetical protein
MVEKYQISIETTLVAILLGIYEGFCTIIGDYIIRVNNTLYTLRPPKGVSLLYTHIQFCQVKNNKNNT